MKRLFFLIALLSSISVVSYGQFDPTEDTKAIGCNNGIDDDGDGFIDCFDSQCVDKQICDGGYVGNDASCTVVQPPAPKFTMTLDFKSDDETVNHLGRVVVGDLDRDGIPEMVTTNKFTKTIMILSGATGAVKKSIVTTFAPSYEEIAIANLDNDNCAEIFVIDGSWNLYSYDCNLTQLWKVKLPGDPGMIGIADFGADGKSEIYVRDAIYDAKTGVEIVESAANLAGNWNTTNGGPVAVDMNEDLKLDLVVGCTIYDVNLGGRTFHSGALSVQKTLPDYFVRNTLNATSIADFDLDGKLDVLASGSTIANGKNTTIFYWNPTKNEYHTFFDSSPTAYLPDGWKFGTGRLNIADLDGDGQLDVSYVSGKFLYALGWDGTNLVKKTWAPKVVNEETSGYTGCTLFDFNGDGQSEIVYRDEKNLYIINGTNGAIYSQQTCVSRTNREYPIVADVDADGSTEICVTCRTVDYYPGTDVNGVPNDDIDFNDINRSRYSQVRVFKSASEPWVPARRVWNQHGYFNVNVNDNLTIPTNQQLHHLKFSSQPCRAGDPPTDHRPLNSFLNQSPYIDVKGCPQYAAADIGFLGNIIIVNPTCPETDFSVTFNITNKGDLALTGNFPVTFYKGDPSLATAIRLNTIFKTLNNFKKDSVTTISGTVQGDGSAFKLYIVLNDQGTGPIPIKLPNSNLIDCPDNNTKDADVAPLPADINTTTTPNFQCASSTAPPNGTASATVPINGADNNTEFIFYWSNGNTVVSPPDYTGPTYTGLAAGDYAVYGVHKTANCNTKTTIVATVPPGLGTDPTVVIQEIQPYDNCKNPNGKFDLDVNSGDNLGNYTYIWWETDFVFGDTLSLNHSIDVLKPISYTVKVTDKKTGCNSLTARNVTDNSPKLQVTVAAKDIDCSGADNGELTATLTVDGSIVNSPTAYKFSWYRGNSVKPGNPDFEGPAYTASVLNNKAAGNYTLFVSEPISGCSSDTATVTIKQTKPPVITATSKTDQMSCDPSNPNGSASATVDFPANYTYQWYEGQGTTTPITNATNISLSGLKKGFYTIEVKQISTQCTSTAEVFVDNAIQTLTITPNPSPNSGCTAKTGSITVNGLPGPDTDYTFFLDDGSTIKQQIDNRVFSSLAAGSYTVWAVDKATKCESNIQPADVVDNIVRFTIAATLFPPSTCSTSDGVVNVAAPANTLGYTFKWYEGGAAVGTEKTPHTDTPTTSILSSIPSGDYTVSVQNLDNGCIQDSSLFLGLVNAQIIKATHVDITNCVPGTGGSISAQLQTTSGLDDTHYDVFYYQSTKDLKTDGSDASPLTSAGETSPGSGKYSFPSAVGEAFQIDYYTIVAIPKAGDPAILPSLRDCRASATVQVKQVVSKPIINQNVTNNTKCTYSVNTGVIDGNGLIHLKLGKTGADPAVNYDYTWKKTSEVPPVTLTKLTPNLPGAASFEDAKLLSPGTYEVTVTYSDPTKANFGCFNTKTIPVLDIPQIIDILPITASVSNCDATNGFNPATTAVSLNGVKVDGSLVAWPAAGFTLNWYNTDGSTMALPDGTNPSQPVVPNDYSVKIANTSTGCLQNRTFTVENKIDTVGVDLVSFQEQIICIDPMGGFLKVIGTTTSSTAGAFTYSWYDGANPNFMAASNYPSAVDSLANVLSGQQYTVLVKDANTNCWAKDTYSIGSNKLPVLIRASSTPLTLCTVPSDASLTASVILPPNPPPGIATSINQSDYTFVWKINGVTQNTAQYSTNVVSNVSEADLDLGAITVMAIEKNDPTNCFSETIPVPIDTIRIYPNVSASPFRDVKTCDITKPDGMATAVVDGNNISNYIFEWYEGAPPLDPNKKRFYPGPTIDSLKSNTTYTVVAIDRITGCSNTAGTQVGDDPIPVALTNVEVVSNITNCLPLLPNGSLLAVVDRPIEYSYRWTWKKKDGSTGTLPPTDTTQLIENLDEGEYTVKVKNYITKCEATASASIIPAQVNPDFDFVIQDASCGKDNGYVALFLTNTSEIDIDSIWWEGVSPEQTGPILTGVPAGDYTATVLTRFGCMKTLPVTINTDIHPFNGISKDSPGKNDYFHIDCIEEFPNNLVKIYNRAGTLVYEAGGYNNLDTLFDGKSNKGVSWLGTDLPDGTYFYIIDKRDGSKRLAGYLEIVN
jgi:large repetitive protein